MNDKPAFRLADILSMTLSLITLAAVISGGIFWFYQTNALPSRVTTVEERVDKLEKQLIENNTKTELIYQAILEVRSALLHK